VNPERFSSEADLPEVKLVGEFDLANSRLLFHAVTRVHRKVQRDLVVDLTDVTFFDASALRQLDAARRSVEADGDRVFLRSSPAVDLVLGVTRVHFDRCPAPVLDAERRTGRRPLRVEPRQRSAMHHWTHRTRIDAQICRLRGDRAHHGQRVQRLARGRIGGAPILWSARLLPR
jgi:anti-anti-sigma factor